METDPLQHKKKLENLLETLKELNSDLDNIIALGSEIKGLGININKFIN